MGKEILLNQLFTGRYLDMGENLGHETVNLFKADDGQFYLYVPKSGDVDRDVETILFTRTERGQKTVEVIAIATSLHRVEKPLSEISYGGVPLPALFAEGNVWKDKEAETVSDSYMKVTYKADSVSIASGGKRVFVTTDESFAPQDPQRSETVFLDSEKDRHISNSSMRKYYPEGCKAYRDLLELVRQANLWEELDGRLPEIGAAARPASFLEIIRKEDDELVFSNLFARYFEYDPEVFRSLASEVLGLEGMDLPYVIRREHNHIDILVESARYAIVIENKVGSGINGRGKDDINQLDTYKEVTEKETKSDEVRCFLLYPDYRDVELRREAERKGYEPVLYSELHDFFSRNAAAFAEEGHCFTEFLRGLERHSVKTTMERTIETMRSRFQERIQQLKR